MQDNIYPIFNSTLTKKEKEDVLNQKGITFWFTGLSGSGKSTLANLLERRLTSDQIICTLLDGDNIRNGINSDLTFTDEDRKENIRRISEINKLLNSAGIVSISSFISPTNAVRSFAKNIIGNDSFVEIFVNTSIEDCEKRDVKGLYEKARKGEIKNFTGIDAPYEPPVSPDFVIDTAIGTPEYCVELIYEQFKKIIKKT